MPILYPDMDLGEKDTREKYYRVDGYENGGSITIYTTNYPVISKTPCGVWIDTTYYMGSYSKRFINNSWKKRWACPTVEEALQSFKARKTRQVSILKARLQDAVDYLEASKVCAFNPDGYFYYKPKIRFIEFDE